MTLTDRKIRFEIIARLNGKTKEEVVNKIKKIKSIIKTNLNDIIKSINNESVDGKNTEEASNIIKSSKDTKVNVVVNRNGEKTCLLCKKRC
jgi:IS30 family transposase